MVIGMWRCGEPALVTTVNKSIENEAFSHNNKIGMLVTTVEISY